MMVTMAVAREKEEKRIISEVRKARTSLVFLYNFLKVEKSLFTEVHIIERIIEKSFRPSFRDVVPK